MPFGYKRQDFERAWEGWVFIPKLQILLWIWHGPCSPGTHLEHLADLPAGQAHVQLVQQLLDLLDVQQPVPVLVSLLEGLLHPAASVSRTATGISSPEGRQGSSGKDPFCPDHSSVKCFKAQLVYGNCSQLSSQPQPLCTPICHAVPPLRTCSKVLKYCWAYSGIFFHPSLHST